MSPPLQRALDLAEAVRGQTTPNPAVGCVVVSASGEVLAEGATAAAGGPHAEAAALQQARERGIDLAGSTVFVTLEPCAHHGRTPPCADALVRAGVSRVVVALKDPNPKVNGGGMARLRDAGVAVELLPADHPLARRAREQNRGFLSRMVRGRPWVRLKVALSLDGRTALANGQSQWITGPQARADGHAWRALACRVMTGVGTVRQDDPLLTVREVATSRQPPLVVVDSRLETPPDARLWREPRPVTLVHACDPDRLPDRARALEQMGATLLACGPLDPAGRTGDRGHKVDLRRLLEQLGHDEVNDVHLEAGQRLNGSFIASGLVDELLVYLAPRLIGPGQDLAHLPELGQLADAVTLQWTDITPLGADLRLRATVAGQDDF